MIERSAAEEMLQRAVPEVKIIVMLRNPVDVIYSTYLKLKEKDVVKDVFEEELERNTELYKLGYYHENLRPFFNLFPREHIYIRQFEKFFENQLDECKNLYKFVGVDASFRPSIINKKINERRIVRSRKFVQLRHRFGNLVNKKPILPLKRLITYGGFLDSFDQRILERNLTKGNIPTMSVDTRVKLFEHFRSDSERLQEIANVDLDLWRA